MKLDGRCYRAIPETGQIARTITQMVFISK